MKIKMNNHKFFLDAIKLFLNNFKFIKINIISLNNIINYYLMLKGL